jgi:hypothetical protein
MKLDPLSYEQGLIVRELANTITSFGGRNLTARDAMMALLYMTAGVIVTCAGDAGAARTTVETFVTLLPLRVEEALVEVDKAGEA